MPKERQIPAIAAVVSGSMIIVGALLPWARVGIFSVAGTDGDGMVTLIVGMSIVAVALAWGLGRGARGPLLAISLLGIVVLAIGIYDAVNISTAIRDFRSEMDGNMLAGLFAPSVGMGLVVTIFGGFVALATGVVGLWNLPSAAIEQRPLS
ncbi:MAG: hypothetical protein O2919_07335 [Chloroflexi bacterium]|nr:hypothetical protein [Chloroflexota bacterium]